MPAAKFRYINQVTAAVTEITFSRSPVRPLFSLDMIQPKEQSAADVMFVYTSLTTNDLFELPLRLTSEERASLESFFINVVMGQAEPFYYVNSAGIGVPVKFNQSTLDIKEIAYNSHSATVPLRVQP